MTAVVISTLRALGAARRAIGRVMLSLTPPPEPLCAGCGFGHRQCGCDKMEEAWQDFLEQNPNQRTEILLAGKEYFGFPHDTKRGEE